MNFRRHISLLTLLLMLGLQGVLAHHQAVHAAEHIAVTGHADQDTHDDEGAAPDVCDFCLLSKNLQQSATPKPVVLSLPVTQAGAYDGQAPDSLVQSAEEGAYAARAPPAV